VQRDIDLLAELENLTAQSSIVIYDCIEDSDGDLIWQELKPSGLFSLVQIHIFPDEVKARLCVVEGVTEKVRNAFSNSVLSIPTGFFELHTAGSLRQTDPRFISVTSGFFAKWPRSVTQTAEQWEIERKISNGKPWNIDMDRDPHSVRLDHQRYVHPPGIYRPSWPIGTNLTGNMSLAAMESVSFHWGDYKGKDIGTPTRMRC